MVTPEFLSVFPRLFFYFLLFFALDQWVWGRSPVVTFFRAWGLAILRMALGALVGYLIIRYFSLPEYQHGVTSLGTSSALALVVTRFFLWSGCFLVLRAGGLRLAAGIAGGMAINLVMDLFQQPQSIAGIPFYC